MKTVLLTLLLLFISQGAYAQVFTIDAKGIVKCKGAKAGDRATLGGITYEAVDDVLLRYRWNQGVDMTKVCTSLVTDMSALFNSSNFNQAIGNWDVSNVEKMDGMFGNTPFNQPIANWDVSNVKDMRALFARSSFNQPIDNWNVSNVRIMAAMFSRSSFNQPIGNWNVGNVTEMSAMFSNSLFNQPIGGWNVGNVVWMTDMFKESSFDQPIGNWNVYNVTSMKQMFFRSSFNQPIGDWDVRNVTEMFEMFYLSKFNQPINKWCVYSIKTEPINFSKSSPLTSENKPVWGTCVGMPPKPLLLLPMDNSNDITPRPRLEWNATNDASKYNVEVFEGIYDVVLDTLSSTTSLSIIDSFKSTAAYYWRVRGYNETKKLWGEWSDVWKFTVINIPTPLLLAPANGSTGLSGSVVLNWNSSANTNEYHLQVSTNNIFTALRVNGNVGFTTFTLSSFQPGDPIWYYWRVRSNGIHGPGAWSPVWYFTRAKLTSTGDEADVPAEFSLSQNFPNPFNPTTQISFTLPTSTTVRLEVFSSLGQPVSVIAEGQLAAGAHTYAFDGAALSSGVYLYRLTTPDFVQTRVMALVK